ncbi:hypothetical protein CUU54_06965 [Pectobacterium polaris]|uniref:hypothetical protein n=1 Tax=Pectobacterium polaris TaxID=2042057 RepID=UPI0011B21907|nr:hypothetical protein [Pectobacterium polaris]MCU1788599.1 hypothetical protein [Pectobacterium polaris]
MERHRPHGRTVTTLEADLLKLRALEMVLVLFYVENLKDFIISSVNVTKRLRKIIDSTKITTNNEEQISFKKAHELLISEGVITQEESLQLREMIDYRNTIGHEIYKITIDIGAYSNLAEYDLPNENKIAKYNYSAVQHIQNIRKKVERKMMEKSFCFELSFDTLAFDAAEQTYLKEIKRLKKKVNTGIDKLNITIEATNKIIRNIPREVMDTIQPGHPKNTKNNGTFSPEGTKGMFMLYDAKATPLAAAYIMRVSYRTASKWYKKWSKNQTKT